jgi:lipoyl(octanoyl) transferase
MHVSNAIVGNVMDLGLIDYDHAWKLQEEYALQIANGQRLPTLLLLEHPHVYTFGRKGHEENLLLAQEQLDERRIAVRWVDRGGDVTYHGPGQLVGYPLIPLGRPGLAAAAGEKGGMRLPEADYVGYVRRLEKMLIATLARFGLVGAQRPGLTGVWIQADVASRCPRCRPEDRRKPAKIAAIGVKVDARGVSRHGFALNVDPDMSYWNGIVACGLVGSPVVSMADLLPVPPAMSDVKNIVRAAFEQEFGWEAG